MDWPLGGPPPSGSGLRPFPAFPFPPTAYAMQFGGYFNGAQPYHFNFPYFQNYPHFPYPAPTMPVCPPQYLISPAPPLIPQQSVPFQIHPVHQPLATSGNREETEYPTQNDDMEISQSSGVSKCSPPQFVRCDVKEAVRENAGTVTGNSEEVTGNAEAVTGNAEAVTDNEEGNAEAGTQNVVLSHQVDNEFDEKNGNALNALKQVLDGYFAGEEVSSELLIQGGVDKEGHKNNAPACDELAMESIEDSSEGELNNKVGQYTTKDVFLYLKSKMYPPMCASKNERRSFRKSTQAFSIMQGKLYHKASTGKKTPHGRDVETFPGYALVVESRVQQLHLLKSAHEGNDTSVQAVALSSHRGQKATNDILARRVWWPSLSRDVKHYVRSCVNCQHVNSATLRGKEELHPIPPPRENLRQIGIDLIKLPESDGFNYLAVAIDYLSKYCHAKPLKTKTAFEVAEFIFDWIALFSFPTIIINDQGGEFCNLVMDELQKLTGVKQRVTSAYNPRANGLTERENRKLKLAFLKVLQECIEKWPEVVNPVLLALRTQKQRSTGYSPFFMLFGREPTLPIDLLIANGLDESEDEEKVDDPWVTGPEINDITSADSLDNIEREVTPELYSTYVDDNIEDEVVTVNQFVKKHLQLKTQVLAKAKTNIRRAQRTQKREYDKRHASGVEFKVGDKVLKKDLRRDTRKGDYQVLPYKSLYIISRISDNGKIYIRNARTDHEMAQGWYGGSLEMASDEDIKRIQKSWKKKKKAEEKDLKKGRSAQGIKKFVDRPDNVNLDKAIAKAAGHRKRPNVPHDLISSEDESPGSATTIKANSDDVKNVCITGSGNENGHDEETIHTTSTDASSEQTKAAGALQVAVTSSEKDAVVDITDGDDSGPKTPMLHTKPSSSKKDIEQYRLMDPATVLASKFKYSFRVMDLNIMLSEEWLNDEIINLYFKLIEDKYSSEKMKVHVFNTQFFSKLKSNGFESVKKWTKNVDIFSMDLLLMPIHADESHWVLIAVYPQLKLIEYYDSFLVHNVDRIEDILCYLEKECRDKKNQVFDRKNWTSLNVTNITRQCDGFQCGVHVCLYGRQLACQQCCRVEADAISRLRKQMVVELIHLAILPADFLVEDYSRAEIHKPLRPLYCLPESSRHDLCRGGGLKNLGNTCYVNSVLQLLFHCQPFITWLRDDKELFNANSVTRQLQDTLKKTRDCKVFEPIGFVGKKADVCKRMEGKTEEDAHEFLASLLRKLAEEFLSTKRDLEELNRRSLETTPLEIIFGLFLRTEVKCNECKELAESFQHVPMPSLQVKGVRRLETALGKLFRIESVDGICSQCRHQGRMTKSVTLERPPRVLLLHLMRFDHKGTKLEEDIKYPDELSLDTYISRTSPAKKDCWKYKLRGVVQHTYQETQQEDRTVLVGHYTCTANLDKKGCYHFNDSQVMSCDMQSMHSKNTYLLMYELL